MTIINWQKAGFVKNLANSFSMFDTKVFFIAASVMLLLFPFAGYAEQTIDIANMFPSKIIDLEEFDSEQGADPQGKGYGFTKRYHKKGETYSYIGIALIELSRQALRQDVLGPGVTESRWRQALRQNISKAPRGTPAEEINKYYRIIDTGGWSDDANQKDGFRIVMEANDPGKRLIGFFRFYNYMCWIDSIGNHATYDYFDEAFRLILDRLGWGAK